VSAPVELSRLNPTIALFFVSDANKKRPPGSTTGLVRTEVEENGEPDSGVNAPLFASTLKPSIPPGAPAETYKNFPSFL